jgi:hypothetical protein
MVSFGAQQRIAASLDRIVRAETTGPRPQRPRLKPMCLHCRARGGLRVHRDANRRVTIWCSACQVEPKD